MADVLKVPSRLDDLNVLASAALQAITKALKDADARTKYAPGSWMEEDYRHQLERARQHLQTLWLGLEGINPDDELAHLICRVAIAYALRERQEALELVKQAVISSDDEDKPEGEL